jgi:hypothetical protein
MANINKAYRFETRFFLITLPAVAIITLAGWAKADSGIVKGPGLSLGNAKQRTCQIVERTDETGKVTRKLECSKGKKGKSK